MTKRFTKRKAAKTALTPEQKTQALLRKQQAALLLRRRRAKSGQ